MVVRKHGRILITGSIAGFYPGTFHAVYNASQGWDAMIAGQGDVVMGWMNKLRSAMATITPSETLAEQHRSMPEPGSGKP